MLLQVQSFYRFEILIVQWSFVSQRQIFTPDLISLKFWCNENLARPGPWVCRRPFDPLHHTWVHPSGSSGCPLCFKLIWCVCAHCFCFLYRLTVKHFVTFICEICSIYQVDWLVLIAEWCHLVVLEVQVSVCFRCLRVNCACLQDPWLQQACERSAVRPDDLGLPKELTVWVDPGEVSCRSLNTALRCSS